MTNKELCECYPFLIPRNVWTGKIIEGYDYSYVRGDYELPKGWLRLFRQMCEDIRQPLVDANYLDKFRFSQIKEKYNTMCCYHFGAPVEVQDIINKYEYISSFVCQNCGKPATWEMQGWIESRCDECIGDEKECAEPIKFKSIMKITQWSNGVKKEIEIDCSEEWDRLFGTEQKN